MEKTGITRRIDSLGRIVIPKEIRKSLRISDSDEMTISIMNDEIVLTKADGIEKNKAIKSLLYSLSHFFKINVLLTSKESIIDKSLVDKKEYENIFLSNYLKDIIQKRKEIVSSLDKINLFNRDDNLSYIIEPLIINGDLVGSLIAFSKKDLSQSVLNFLLFSIKFLENYLE